MSRKRVRHLRAARFLVLAAGLLLLVSCSSVAESLQNSSMMRKISRDQTYGRTTTDPRTGGNKYVKVYGLQQGSYAVIDNTYEKPYEGTAPAELPLDGIQYFLAEFGRIPDNHRHLDPISRSVQTALADRGIASLHFVDGGTWVHVHMWFYKPRRQLMANIYGGDINLETQAMEFSQTGTVK